MMIHNVATTSVSFGARRSLLDALPDLVHEKPGVMSAVKAATVAGTDNKKVAAIVAAVEAQGGASQLYDLLRDDFRREDMEFALGGIERKIDALSGQIGANLNGKIEDLTERLEALERSGVQTATQNENIMKFISKHKTAIGASAAALLAVGIAGFAYSKHNKKRQAERDAADPALYTPPPVNQAPQPAVVEAPVSPVPSAPVSSSLNDYFVKTA